jgi:hypothetical protein
MSGASLARKSALTFPFYPIFKRIQLIKNTVMESRNVEFRSDLAMLILKPLQHIRNQKIVLLLLMLVLFGIESQGQIKRDVDAVNFSPVEALNGDKQIWQVGMQIEANEAITAMVGQIELNIADTLALTWMSAFSNTSIQYVATSQAHVYHVKFQCNTTTPLEQGEVAWIGFVLDEGYSMEAVNARLGGIVTVDVMEFGNHHEVNEHDSSLIVFPNPATDFIYLSQSAGLRVREIVLLDGQMQEWQKFVPEPFVTRISLTGLPKGRYYLRCQRLDGSYCHLSFMKQE